MDWPCLLGAVLLATGTLAIYWRTFSVPFLFDDFLSILGNPSIRRLWPLWSALRPPDGAGVGARPLLNLSFAVNFACSGNAVYGYHFTNLVIHMLASCALFGVVRRTLRRPAMVSRFGRAADPLALAASALWAWHPLQTLSVTYLSQRAESLAGLFYLVTLYCFVRGSEKDGGYSRRIWFPLAVLACLCGAATKELVVTAPLMVLIYDRTFVSGDFSTAWRKNWKLYLALALALLPVGHRILILQEGGVVSGVGFGGGIAWWDYALTESRVVLRYLLLAVWPHPLVFDYGPTVPSRLSEMWPYAASLGLILAGSAVALRRWPVAGFAACWFFLILAPTSSVIPIVGQSMAENRLYLPLAGVVTAGVLAAFTVLGRGSLPVLAVLAAVLGLASFQRNRAYASELEIWSDTVAKSPLNARAHGNLGKVLARMPSRLDEAIAQYKEASHLDPSAAEVHVNLGNLWFRMPDHLDDAVSQYREALSLKPDDADAHYDLACALVRTPGLLDDAVAHYEEALRLRPDFAAAHINLGNALLRIPSRTGDALAHLEEAVRLRPAWPEAQVALGTALLEIPGRSDEARAHLLEGLRLQPGNLEAQRMLSELPAPGP